MRQNRTLHLLMALLLAALLCPAAALADYSFQVVSPDEVGVEYTRPIPADLIQAVGAFPGGAGVDINNNGLIVGMRAFGLSCDGDFSIQPFVWDPTSGMDNSYNATVEDLVTGGSAFRAVYDINNNGEITGYLMNTDVACEDLPINIPFVLNSTGIDELWDPGVDGPIARFDFLNKFLHNDNGQMTTNLVGDVVVDSYLDQKYLCVWNEGELPDPLTDPVPYLESGLHDHPLDVNNNGVVVGWANLGPEPVDIPAAFAYDNTTQTMTVLPVASLPEGSMPVAVAINSANTIVGAYSLTDSQYVIYEDMGAVVWRYNEATSQWEEPIVLPGYAGDPAGICEATAGYSYDSVSGDLTATFNDVDPCFPAGSGDSISMNLAWVSSTAINLEVYAGTTVAGSMTRSDGDLGDLDGTWEVVLDEPIPGIGSSISCDFAVISETTGTILWSFSPASQYVAAPLGIADNERILGLAVQLIGNDQEQTFGEAFPVLWEPDGMGGWNDPVKVADLVTGLPDVDELNLTLNMGELLQNIFTLDAQGVRTIFAIVGAENLFATRMSDDGQWIMVGGLADDPRPVTLNGTYSWDGSNLSFDDVDIINWYNQDPLRLHYEDTTIVCSVDSMDQMTLTVNDVTYDVVCVDNFETGGDITGVWAVTDTGYTMTFGDDNLFTIAAGNQPLKKLVQVVLHEGGEPPCCTEDNSGALDILPACQTITNLIRVPIQIQDAPNDVYAMGFDVVFTPEDEPITFVGFEPDELLNGWWHDAQDDVTINFNNLVGANTVRIGAYTVDSPITQHTSGIIGYLVFETTTTQCISFTLENLVDDLAPAGEPWSISGGCLSPTAPSNGDLNNDGQLTPMDALCAFQRALTGDENTFCGTCSETRCDVTQDCECTASDALCIFRAYLMIDDECAQRLLDGMAG